jgi:hypothetical protein
LKLKGARFERPSTGRNITVSVWNLERISQASFNKLNYREQNKTTTQIRERERESVVDVVVVVGRNWKERGGTEIDRDNNDEERSRNITRLLTSLVGGEAALDKTKYAHVTRLLCKLTS